jgi:hypothetical protein
VSLLPTDLLFDSSLEQCKEYGPVCLCAPCSSLQEHWQGVREVFRVLQLLFVLHPFTPLLLLLQLQQHC